MAGHNTPVLFSNSFRTPELQGLQYNTAVAGTVITVVFGTQRLGSNLIQYQDFHESGGGKKGTGKGGGSSKGSGGKKGQSAQTFSVNLGVGICQGPVSFSGSIYTGGGPNQVWVDGGVNNSSGVSNLNLYAGNDGQAVDPTFASSGQNQPAVGYSGTAYATITPFTVQGSPVLPDVDWEVSGFQRGTCGPGFPNDANPANIIQQMLTDNRWGAGFTSAFLDSSTLTNYAQYCQALQLAMSAALDRQQPAAQWIQEWMELTVSAIWQSGATLKFSPYSIVPVSANGVSWVPVFSSPVWTIGDNDIILPGGDDFPAEIGENPEDPLIVTRTDPAMVPNFLALEYRNGANAYNVDVVPVFDQASLQYPAGTVAVLPVTNIRAQPNKEGRCFANATSALASAQLVLQNQMFIRSKPIKFTLGWKHTLVDLMDIIAINDVTLGYVNKQLWVVGIEEQEDGRLALECREIATSNGVLPPVGRQSSTGAPLNIFASPPNVDKPVFVQPTPSLTSAFGYATSDLIIGLSGGLTNPNWGGAQIFVSTDGTTYGYIGTRNGESPIGFLTTTLNGYNGSNPDLSDVLNVNLEQSVGVLMSVSDQAAQQSVSLCALVNPTGQIEFLTYTTATLVAPNQYSLSGLYRGLYSTAALTFPSGSQFIYLGSFQFFNYTVPNQYVGQTLFFKFLSFNTFGQEVQNAEDVVVYQYVPTGSSAVTAVQRTVFGPLEIAGTIAVQRVVRGPLEVLGGVERTVMGPLEVA